ncbi:MAG: outer membrane protein OmpA-like peptidoglycan-associated protein [Myxococcota bacterium]|jgi:outer membrane protein OmpA-like peptidoglycan-associated protein
MLPLLLPLLLLPAAFAQDAVKLEITRTGQQGTAQPALIVLPQQAIAALDVSVQCSGVRQEHHGAVTAGQRVELPLAVPVGEHVCTGSLALRLSDGSEGEMPLSFSVQMLAPLGLTVDRAGVDLEAGTLTAVLDRDVARIDITAYGLSDVTLGSTRHDRAAHPADTPITGLTWESSDPSAEVIRLEVRAQDTAGFWAAVELFPWFYDIPHEDVVFASGAAAIVPEYVGHLQAAMTEIESVQARYGEHAEINLYVGGFTDTVGSAATNRALSERRARAIAAWFRDAGFSASVYYQGFGEDGLAVQTGDEVDEPANRRAAYIIAAQPPPITDTLPGDTWKSL